MSAPDDFNAGVEAVRAECQDHAERIEALERAVARLAGPAAERWRERADAAETAADRADCLEHAQRLEAFAKLAH
jgi:hypothetical protein